MLKRSKTYRRKLKEKRRENDETTKKMLEYWDAIQIFQKLHDEQKQTIDSFENSQSKSRRYNKALSKIRSLSKSVKSDLYLLKSEIISHLRSFEIQISNFTVN